jgi:hypothetical protein
MIFSKTHSFLVYGALLVKHLSGVNVIKLVSFIADNKAK